MMFTLDRIHGKTTTVYNKQLYWINIKLINVQLSNNEICI